jgi:hypothetical protein
MHTHLSLPGLNTRYHTLLVTANENSEADFRSLKYIKDPVSMKGVRVYGQKGKTVPGEGSMCVEKRLGAEERASRT